MPPSEVQADGIIALNPQEAGLAALERIRGLVQREGGESAPEYERERAANNFPA